MIIACSKLLYIDKCRSNLGFSKLDGWDRVEGASTFTKLEAKWDWSWKMENRRISANPILQKWRSRNWCRIPRCGFFKRRSVPLQTGRSLTIIIWMFYVPVNTKVGVWIDAKNFSMMHFRRFCSFNKFKNSSRFFIEKINILSRSGLSWLAGSSQAFQEHSGVPFLLTELFFLGGDVGSRFCTRVSNFWNRQKSGAMSPALLKA